MHTNFFKKNRKGQQWLTSETIIFFFGAILLIGLVAFFLRLQSALFADEDDGSKANFLRLQDEIKEMLDNGVAEKTINYFISEGFIIVGFDTYWENPRGQSKNAENVIFAKDVILKDNLYRSFECGNSACLCLYKTDMLSPLPDKPEDSDKNVLDCKRDGFTDKNIVFSSGVGQFGTGQICPPHGSCVTIQDSYTSKNKLGVNTLRIKIEKISGFYKITISN